MVGNQTSVIFQSKDSVFWHDPETDETGFDQFAYRNKHLVDSLLSLGINIRVAMLDSGDMLPQNSEVLTPASDSVSSSISCKTTSYDVT